MPAYQLQLQEERENELQLREQLEEELSECIEVNKTYRNKVKKFMAEHDIWHISELDYSLREAFHSYLEGYMNPVKYSSYENAFDQIKQHSLRNQLQEVKRKNPKFIYENQLLFLPYHPNQKLVARLEQMHKKADLVWDFRVNAPENMKRQIFHVFFYLIETIQNSKYLRRKMNGLRFLYQYCIEKKIEDIEILELSQIQGIRDALETDINGNKGVGIVDTARKALFLQAKEIPWEANVWYLERFYFQPERINAALPVRSLSYLEISHQRNRELLKQYMRYGLGITNLTINCLQSEFISVRNFLEELGQVDLYTIREVQMDAYLKKLQEKEIQADSYNKIVMSILHFFNFLQVRRYINKIPFSPAFYLKKEIQKHHDRSVELETVREVLLKLHLFPEEIRLMYLHLWGIGLRISEVCTLKGDAYYTHGRDAWIQVYQIKVKRYKRIPIPESLYQMMVVYLKRRGIGAEDFVFANRRGGAYCSSTFRSRMLRCCKENQIQNGEYIFQSHDYRHGIATLFYDKGVSLQGIRDYLGHLYEEMTRQYIDYMPRKLARANDEFFSKHNSLAANLIKGKRGKDGEQSLSKRPVLLPNSNTGTEKEGGEESVL